jgi:hypothetical protein
MTALVTYPASAARGFNPLMPGHDLIAGRPASLL